MVYKPYDVKRIASECGIPWKTIDKIIRQAEKRVPEWDWQEDFDWYTHCSEIRDYGDREKELKRRLNIPLETEKEISIEVEREKEKEIEWLISSKEGVKQLLSRIYKDELTAKQKIELKEKLLNRPDLATLIALYDGEEQDYAKRYLAEMVIAPTRKDVKELLKSDTLKIHSYRGWIKSINDVPVKSLRSIDLIKEIEGYEHVASEKADEGTIAVYRREKPVEVSEPIPPKPVEKPPELRIKKPETKIDELVIKYSYAEVLAMAKQHNIQSGPKIKMVSELIEKKIL